MWKAKCYLCVLWVSVVNFAREPVHHKDTQHTQVAQRRLVAHKEKENEK